MDKSSFGCYCQWWICLADYVEVQSERKQGDNNKRNGRIDEIDPL